LLFFDTANYDDVAVHDVLTELKSSFFSDVDKEKGTLYTTQKMATMLAPEQGERKMRMCDEEQGIP
jgi:hypothetical protein